MNALHVTLSIPFLLVLAGFNHAHGFTTFGKTQTVPPPPPPPPVPAKVCTNHTECRAIPQTSCIETKNPHRKSCLCGDNRPPVNGICSAKDKGPHHTCLEDTDCVERASCLPMYENKDDVKICKCIEDSYPIDAYCSGGNSILMTAMALSLLMATIKFMF